MLNASVWVLIAFCILIFSLGRPAWRALMTYLDQHALKVRKDLQEAKSLHKQAQDLLNETKHLQIEAAHRAEEIMRYAKAQAEALQKASQEDLQTYIQTEERLLLEKLTRIEAQAITDIENKALDATISAARHTLSQTLQSSDQDQLFAEAFAHIKDTSLTSKCS